MIMIKRAFIHSWTSGFERLEKKKINNDIVCIDLWELMTYSKE